MNGLHVVTFRESLSGLTWGCTCRATGAGDRLKVEESGRAHARGHVAEARAAALNEAADAIEAASPETAHGGNSRPHSFASDCAKCGGQRAARIVRDLAAPPPP